MNSKFEKNQLLHQIKEKSLEGGGKERIEAQHKKGKLTARERIALLLDEGTFQEIDAFVTHRCVDFGMENEKYYGDGVVTGFGKIFGRNVFVYAQDFTVFGGTLSETHAQKICKILDLAIENRCPIIGLNDSGGARIQEGVVSLGGYADIFFRNTKASGLIPQLSAILGPCAGGAVYSPAITDFIFMVENSSYMFVTGPNVVKTVTHEQVTAEELGGAHTHSIKSGICHFSYDNEFNLLQNLRNILKYIPQSADSKSLKYNYTPNNAEIRPLLDLIIPDNSSQPYKIKEVIIEIADNETFVEIQKDYAENIVIGFALLAGRSIGIVANQPSSLAGVLDIKASAKAARFVRFCDSFNIPLLILEDVPGFMPGTDQEWNGIINEGAKLLYAFCEATVPRITVITRKAYGGAYDVMNSKHIGADFNFAWPTAEIAVMGAKGAAEIIFKKEIANADNPEQTLSNLISNYSEKFANPYQAASKGYVDDVILPSETRKKLISAFELLENKKVISIPKKHGNIPL